MTSLFSGYELKIFSFHQEDFKGDRRAGEFFRDLKTGIGSAFNDPIIICFSIFDHLKFTAFTPIEKIC